ncbi:MAG: SRPBCC family protein [Bacteroidota bacterium]
MKIFKYIALVLVGLLIIFFSIGLFQPEISYTNKVIINADPHKVYTLFQDTTKMKEWMPGFNSFTSIKGKPATVGSQWKLILIQEGEKYEMNETLTIIKPDEQYSFILDNAVLSNNVDMYFKPVAGKTELTVENKVRGNNIMWRSLFYFFKGRLTEQSSMMYDGLKKMIENTPG